MHYNTVLYAQYQILNVNSQQLQASRKGNNGLCAMDVPKHQMSETSNTPYHVKYLPSPKTSSIMPTTELKNYRHISNPQQKL